jgi:hypothetical protein
MPVVNCCNLPRQMQTLILAQTQTSRREQCRTMREGAQVGLVGVTLVARVERGNHKNVVRMEALSGVRGMKRKEGLGDLPKP